MHRRLIFSNSTAISSKPSTTPWRSYGRDDRRQADFLRASAVSSFPGNPARDSPPFRGLLVLRIGVPSPTLTVHTGRHVDGDDKDEFTSTRRGPLSPRAHRSEERRVGKKMRSRWC